MKQTDRLKSNIFTEKRWSRYSRLESLVDFDVTHLLLVSIQIFRENDKIAEATEEAKEQHYEVPTEFFKLTLGPWLKYSSCYYPDGCTSLKVLE